MTFKLRRTDDDDDDDDVSTLTSTNRVTIQELEKEFEEMVQSIADATLAVDAQTVIASLSTQDSSHKYVDLTLMYRR